MTTDANDWLMSGGGKSAKFEKHGDTVSGFITEHPQIRQQTDFTTGKPKFYDDGNPQTQMVVTLLTEERDDDDDDGIRKVYVKGQMKFAVQEAVKKAGQRGLAEGGRLVVKYVGDAEPKSRGMSGAKQYQARYEAPQMAVLQDDDDPGYTDDDLPF